MQIVSCSQIPYSAIFAALRPFARESYREGGKVKSRTLANTSDWPEDEIEEALAGCWPESTLVPLGAELFEIARALLRDGHVAAVLGTVRRLGLDKMLPNGPERRAKLILAMIVAWTIQPVAKLATPRQAQRGDRRPLARVRANGLFDPGGVRRGRAPREPPPSGPQPERGREGPR